MQITTKVVISILARDMELYPILLFSDIRQVNLFLRQSGFLHQ
jgi:hypothetical protein